MHRAPTGQNYIRRMVDHRSWVRWGDPIPITSRDRAMINPYMNSTRSCHVASVLRPNEYFYTGLREPSQLFLEILV